MLKKIFFCFDMLQKKIIYRIDSGAETAVYQAWLLKKNLTFNSLWKKNLASNGVWTKNPALTSTEKNNLLKKSLPALPPR